MTLDERRLTSVTIPASVLKPVCTLFSAAVGGSADRVIAPTTPSGDARNDVEATGMNRHSLNALSTGVENLTTKAF